MSSHILTSEALALRGLSEPHVEIREGVIYVVCGTEVRLPLIRNAREVAYMLCEAAAELEREEWHDRERRWKAGG